MAMPTCKTCGKKWYGKPESTICGQCVAKKKTIDTSTMETVVLDNNVEQIKNRKTQIQYADRVKANRMKRLNQKRKRPKRR